MFWIALVDMTIPLISKRSKNKSKLKESCKMQHTKWIVHFERYKIYQQILSPTNNNNNLPTYQRCKSEKKLYATLELELHHVCIISMIQTEFISVMLHFYSCFKITCVIHLWWARQNPLVLSVTFCADWIKKKCWRELDQCIFNF